MFENVFAYASSLHPIWAQSYVIIIVSVQWRNLASRQSKSTTNLLEDSRRESTQRLREDAERGSALERRSQKIGFGARPDGNKECRSRGLLAEVLGSRKQKYAEK